jgi:MFS family permease
MSRMEQGDPIQYRDPPHELLQDDLFPPDSYSGTTYWADLPFRERLKWVNEMSNDEARRGLKSLGASFKADPLQPIRDYFSKYVIVGMGLFVEGYTLFSVGNLASLFEDVFPTCWKTYTECSANLIASVDYLEIAGIILGQLIVGIIGDWIGRRWGMIQDVVIMFFATVLLTAMWGKTLAGWIAMYVVSLFIYGFGVRGEYPMTSTRAMEGHHGPGSSIADRRHRGRNVLLAFNMQGWGQMANQGILVVSLLIFHGGGNPPYSELSAQWTFRVSFAFIGLITFYLIYHRVYKLEFADHHLQDAKKKHNVTGYDTKSRRQTILASPSRNSWMLVL